MAAAPAAKSAAPAEAAQAADDGAETTEASMASADDTAETADAASSAATETAAIDGEAIYNQACMACHASGVGGAPVVGDIDSWSPRIAKGIEALHNSGINGVSGTAMMAKGGRADLSDQQVMAAVDYMVGASQ
jgi:cytochrome c5